MVKRPKSAISLAPVVLIVVMIGCSGDEGAPVATLENIWPGFDGASWSYRLHTRSWAEETPIPYQLTPPVPTFEEVNGLLRSHAVGEGVQDTLIGYRLQFSRAMTFSDTTGLFVDETFSVLDPLESDRENLQQGNRGSSRSLAPFSPLFQLGTSGIWKKTADAVEFLVGYETTWTWRYLESDLLPGHEFVFTIPVSSINEYVVHVRVTRTLTYRTATTDFENAVEVVYILDFGNTTLTQVGSAEPVGYSRTYSYGKIIYAPLVGPVYAYQRSFCQSRPAGQAATSKGRGDQVMTFVSASVN